MKLRRRKIAKQYQAVQSAGYSHVYRRPYIIPILGLLLGGVIVAAAVLTHGNAIFKPPSSYVVFLTDDGKTETLDTKAPTVGALLSRLPLNLIPQDVVEPSLTTPIFDDNFRINIYRARPVTVVVGNTRIVTLTAQQSARQVAEDAGVSLEPEDLATFAQGNLADNIIGEQVIVSKATPITLNLYGSQVPTYTQAKTVGGMLQEKNITLDNGETVSPSQNTPITPNMLVFILAKDTQVVTESVTIPAPVQDQSDAQLSFGTTAVLQNGEAGREIDTYLITGQAGLIPGRKLIQQIIVQNPVPQIVAVGDAVDIPSAQVSVMAAAGIPSSDFQYVNYILSRESGWCPTKLQGDIGYCPTAPPADIPDYLGYGLGQATPGYKMAANGSDWETNPVTQLEWCNNYALTRYGSWAAAYYHWVNNGNW